MDNVDYKKIVAKYTPSEDKLKNMLYAFVSGGIIGILGVGLYQILQGFNVEASSAGGYVSIIFILVASVLTGIGVFDKLVEKFKCGIIIPTTGFAHSIAASIIDAKHDGMITGIGSSVFKLAGSVILYGTVSAFVLAIIRVIING